MHMNNIAGAIALGNLRSLDKVLEKRKKLRDFYNSQDDIACYNWLCVQYGDFENVDQHHFRNDRYTIFKKFKNACPIMDKMEYRWRLLPFHHDVTIQDALEAISEP